MSGWETGPVWFEVHDADEDVDGYKDDEGDATKDKVVIIEEVVVITELCEVDEDEANEKPEDDENVGRHCNNWHFPHYITFCALFLRGWRPVEPTWNENVKEAGEP